MIDTNMLQILSIIEKVENIFLINNLSILINLVNLNFIGNFQI